MHVLYEISGTALLVEETSNENSTQQSLTPNGDGDAEVRGPPAGWRHGLPPAYSNQRNRANGDTPARSVQSDTALVAPNHGRRSPAASSTPTASNGRVAPASGARPKIRAPRPAPATPAAPQVQMSNQATSVTVADFAEPVAVLSTENAAVPGNLLN